MTLPSGPIKAEKIPKKLKPPKGDIYHTIEFRGVSLVYILLATRVMFHTG